MTEIGTGGDDEEVQHPLTSALFLADPLVPSSFPQGLSASPARHSLVSPPPLRSPWPAPSTPSPRPAASSSLSRPTSTPPPWPSPSTTTATGDNLTARVAGFRIPPVAVDPCRDARHERIDYVDTSSSAAAVARRVRLTSTDLPAGLLLQSRAFRRHANGTICVLARTQGKATGSEAAKPAEAVLEWNKQDNKMMLHAVYRVGDLDHTIKYYTECFEMKQ